MRPLVVPAAKCGNALLPDIVERILSGPFNDKLAQLRDDPRRKSWEGAPEILPPLGRFALSQVMFVVFRTILLMIEGVFLSPFVVLVERLKLFRELIATGQLQPASLHIEVVTNEIRITLDPRTAAAFFRLQHTQADFLTEVLQHLRAAELLSIAL